MLGLQKLVFLTADKYQGLTTTLNGVTITDNSDVRIDTLDPIYFYPVIYTSLTRVPDTFLSIFNAAVNGHVQSSFNGKPLFGYPLNMTVKPVMNESQEWKMLLSAANNIDVLLNLEPLLINDDYMATYRLSFPYLCPLQKIPVADILPQYNTVHMDQGLWKEQILKLRQSVKNYFQKWQTKRHHLNSNAIPMG